MTPPLTISYRIDPATDPLGVSAEIYGSEFWPSYRRLTLTITMFALAASALAFWQYASEAGGAPVPAAAAGVLVALALMLWAHRSTYVKSVAAMYAAASTASGLDVEIVITDGRVRVTTAHVHHDAVFSACGDFGVGAQYVRFIAGGTVLYFCKSALDPATLASLTETAKAFTAPPLFAAGIARKHVWRGG